MYVCFNAKEPLWQKESAIAHVAIQPYLCNISSPVPSLFPFVLVKICGCNNYLCECLIPDNYLQTNMKVSVGILQCEKLTAISVYACL